MADIAKLIEKLKRNNIDCFYCVDREEAVNRILGLIPQKASIGISGSVTLDELGVVSRLEARGMRVINQFRPGLNREQSMQLRNEGANADFFLTSANALSQNAELVFLSAYGHRIAGISNAKNVIVVCGVNKITENLDEAIKRAREYATALNMKRLNWDTSKQMICQTLVIESEAAAGRLTVILVDEDLGF